MAFSFLSPSQKRLWFLDRLSGGSPEYNVIQAFWLYGALNLPALEAALNVVIQRHEILRTRFVSLNGEPSQVIAPSLRVLVSVEHDLGTDQTQRGNAIHRVLREESSSAFDLSKLPLIRARLLTFDAERHVVFFNVHHIIIDRWSLGVFNEEVACVYNALVQDCETDLTPLEHQYSEYAQQQEDWLNSSKFRSELDYWNQLLSGAPERLDIPTDRNRPSKRDHKAGQVKLTLCPDMLADIKRFGQKHGCTLYMTMLSAFMALLGRYTGQQDIVVGSPVANRQERTLESLIGFFVNSIPMRGYVDQSSSFGDLLKQIRQLSLDSFDRQSVPFERIVEEVAPKRLLNSAPLYQHEFALQNVPWKAPEMTFLRVEPIELDLLTVRRDLEVHAWERDGELQMLWGYAKDMFDHWRIEHMSRQYIQLLRSAMEDDSQPVRQLSLVTENERADLIDLGAAKQRDVFNKPESVPSVFEQQVVRTPDSIALTFENENISYEILNRRANQLAHQLLAAGVGPGDVVGLCIKRSDHLVVAILGILKSGAAYLPLNTELPESRLQLMLEDTQPSYIVTGSQVANRILNSWPCLAIDDEAETRDFVDMPIHNPSDTERTLPLQAQSAAYVIYTSGSTGTPKGVVSSHENVLRLFHATQDWFRFDASNVWTLFHEISFDFSVWEIWGPLLHGDRLVIVPDQTVKSPEDFLGLLVKERVTILNQTPSAFYQLTQATCEQRDLAAKLSLQQVVFGGETLDLKKLKPWRDDTALPSVQFVNMYGITETTVHATCIALQDDDLDYDARLIGVPIRDLSLRVLDQDMEPTPIGVAGELYVTGPGLARCYLNRPGLTAERFCPDPFSRPGERMYRSGDVVRWRANGSLEYVGRADMQVKIRGYRIELGEIEVAMRRAEKVKGAHVVVRDDANRHPLLVGYVTADGDLSGTELNALRRDLNQTLPPYMVPAAIVKLDRFPLTPNGKLDESALPNPDFSKSQRYDAPRSAEETHMCKILSDILKVEKVGRNDDFFELGGHSLLVVRLVSRIRSQMGKDVAIRSVFEKPTVSQLVGELSLITGTSENNQPQSQSGIAPLSHAQKRLWFIDRLAESSAQFNEIQALMLVGELNLQSLERSLNRIIQRQRSLRTRFPERDGEPVQAILPELRIPLYTEDLSGLPEAEKSAKIENALSQESEQSFDLINGPLIRTRLFKLDERRHVFIRVLHHIISDRWSQGVFNHELTTLYNAYRSSKPDPLPELTIHYADFARQQHDWENRGGIDAGLNYWKTQLADLPDRQQLPSDRTGLLQRKYAAGIHREKLPAHLLESIQALSRKSGTTTHMILLTTLAALISRYTHQPDVTIGTPVANRQNARYENLIGFFVNSIVTRCRVAPDKSFYQLLKETRHATLEGLEYQDVPFDRLVEELAPTRQVSTTPLYQVEFVLQNAPWTPLSLSGLTVAPIELAGLQSRHDLEVHAWENGDEIEISWLYTKDLFDHWRIEQMARHFNQMLKAFLDAPQTKIQEAQFLLPKDKDQILRTWNATDRSYPRLTLPAAFEAQVSRTPVSVAVSSFSLNWTYKQLNDRANKIAFWLIDKGVGPEAIVGLCLDRSVDLVASVLGVLKSGAAYLPLDPEYPDERLHFMLEDAHAHCVISSSHHALRLSSIAQSYSLDDVSTLETIESQQSRNPTNGDRVRPLTDQSPAYLIYTSGSTGRPKGVVGLHQGLINRLVWFADYFGYSPVSPTLGKTSLSFIDGSTELLGPIIHGGKVNLVGASMQGDIDQLQSAISNGRAGAITLVPSLLETLLTHGDHANLQCCKTWITSGERLEARHVTQFAQVLPSATLHNFYGASEASGDSLFARCDQNDGTPAIGRPISNTRVIILDDNLELTPVGVQGEIFIAGLGLARGYLNRPGLTAQHFLPNPFGEPGSIMYATGDLGRYRQDGQIDFLGRRDEQTKIRGVRIEPGEIEATLARHPHVLRSAVSIRKVQNGDHQLVAYLVGHSNDEIDISHLNEYAATFLPRGMLPSFYMQLPDFPLTLSGKLDKHNLPEPQIPANASSDAPTTRKERDMCALFSEVLGLDNVAPDDNFFEMGGHSLLAVKLLSRIRTHFDTTAKLRTLFEAPTPAEFLSRLNETPD